MTLNAAAKRAAARLLPGLRNWRQQRHDRRFEERMGLPRITKAWTARHGLRVLSGPFSGMKYVPQAVGSVLVPKLLGSYECELHPELERLLSTPYAAVVDIGCAEGYYAVGLAQRLPEAQVFAFDISAQAQNLCREMAEVNGVQNRVEVKEGCDPAGLQALLTRFGRCFVVCDCEGCEFSLLDPTHVPALERADLLIELHPSDAASVPSLLSAFADTHTCLLIDSVPRDPSAYPTIECLPDADRANAVCEFRPAGQQWAVLTSCGKDMRT